MGSDKWIALICNKCKHKWTVPSVRTMEGGELRTIKNKPLQCPDIKCRSKYISKQEIKDFEPPNLGVYSTKNETNRSK